MKTLIPAILAGSAALTSSMFSLLARGKSVVGDRVSICDGAFFLQPFHVQGRRRDVGHFEKSGDPSGHRCPGFGPYAGLVSQSGLTKMNLVVDQSG